MYEHNEENVGAVDETGILRPVSDLAGMEVEDASGIPVGSLFGALIEAETGLVRYIDLDLTTLDRHVLVPIGHARIRQLERQEPRIRLRAALLEELEQIPPFPADVAHIDDPFERALLEAYGRTFHGERYYAHPSYDHDGIFAGETPVEGEDATGGDGALRRLSYLPGWRIAAGEPDIRRWPLVPDEGSPLEIRDVIVDTDAGKVRYVVLATGSEEGNARLLPIGFLRVEQEQGRVLCPGLSTEDIRELPVYDGGGLTREQENRLGAALRRQLSGRRRYALPDFRSDG